MAFFMSIPAIRGLAACQVTYCSLSPWTVNKPVGEPRMKVVDGQVGSNAVNLEHRASKVFRPSPQILRRCPGQAHRSSDLFFASSSLGPLFQPLQGSATQF